MAFYATRNLPPVCNRATLGFRDHKIAASLKLADVIFLRRRLPGFRDHKIAASLKPLKKRWRRRRL
jgi:hypothetical protein